MSIATDPTRNSAQTSTQPSARTPAQNAEHIGAALARVRTVLTRKPEAGKHDDSPAAAHWAGGSRMVTSHPNGTRVITDTPTEMGGTGDMVTPGWLFRAGMASCAATSILWTASAAGVHLASLDVRVTSRGDTRGFLGMEHAPGEKVYPGPTDMAIEVRIAAAGTPDDTLRAIVEESLRRSPVPTAVRHPTPFDVRIEIEAA